MQQIDLAYEIDKLEKEKEKMLICLETIKEHQELNMKNSDPQLYKLSSIWFIVNKCLKEVSR